MTLAYWCILIASLLPLFCSFIAKSQGGFQPSDNRNPRDFLARTQGLSARANAAQATINLLAISFIAFRIAYIFSYLKDKPSLRSAMWTGGFVCTIGLFVAAV